MVSRTPSSEWDRNGKSAAPAPRVVAWVAALAGVVASQIAPGGNQSDTERGSERPPPVGEAAAAPPPSEQLPTYDELPSELRRQVPRPKMSVHRYAEDPKERYALINGFHGREGLPIGRELWIYEIRPKGVVLRIQDRFFFLER